LGKYEQWREVQCKFTTIVQQYSLGLLRKVQSFRGVPWTLVCDVRHYPLWDRYPRRTTCNYSWCFTLNAERKSIAASSILEVMLYGSIDLPLQLDCSRLMLACTYVLTCAYLYSNDNGSRKCANTSVDTKYMKTIIVLENNHSLFWCVSCAG